MYTGPDTGKGRRTTPEDPPPCPSMTVSTQGNALSRKELFAVGVPKDLNNPSVYAEALVRAALNPQREALAAWLADEVERWEQAATEMASEREPFYPFQTWYLYFADKLLDMMPRPDLGFQFRPSRAISAPKIGRNDPCPCGSRKKYKQCHMTAGNGAEVMAWKLAPPTPAIRAMTVAHLVHQMPLTLLDNVPREMASTVALTEMASVYQGHGQLDEALVLLGGVLDGPRDDPFLLYDYWIARYAEWLVEAGQSNEGERFLLDEYHAPRVVSAWQVAQKLAAFYLDQGDLNNAESWIEVALEGEHENPFNHYLKGLLSHINEAWESAVASYEQAHRFSQQLRDEERGYMEQLVQDALQRAKHHRPVEEEEEEEEERENMEKDAFPSNATAPPPANESQPGDKS